MASVLKIILMSFLIQGSRCQTFSITLQAPSQVLKGSCVLVQCSFTVPTSYEGDLDSSCGAIWKRGSSYMFDSSSNTNRLAGSLAGNMTDKNCTTIFYNLWPSDSGNYKMRIECNILKYNFGDQVNILVQETLANPTIITSPTLPVEEGDGITLNCAAPDPCPSSPPVLRWSPVLGETSLASSSSVMTFNTSYLDNGLKISCTALYQRSPVHGNFSSQSNVVLNVHFPPRQPNISHVGPVIKGSRVTLNCYSTANPDPSFIWFREVGADLVQLSLNWQLTVLASESSNRFHCTARNGLGISSSIIALDVRFAPKDVAVTAGVSGPVTEGDPLVLICNSRANPAASNFTWYKEEVRMPARERNLFIDAVGLGHSGVYKCEAENEMGRSASSPLILDVQYAPKNTSVSKDPPGDVVDGGNVTLTCTSRANPSQVNISWYRVTSTGKQMVGSGEKFSFNAIKLSQDEFFCGASNVHGTKNSDVVKLNVLFAPEILPSSHCVELQAQSRCSCDSRGNPPPRILWEFPSENQTMVGNFNRQSNITLSVLNEGKPFVVCVSVNSLGSDTLVFNVSTLQLQQGLDPLVVGSLIGVLLFLLLSIPLMYYLFIGRKKDPSSDTSLMNPTYCLDTRESNSEINTIYANRKIMDQEEQLDEDQLHYATVQFTKFRGHLSEQQDEGQIWGLSSKTAEYAEVRLCSKESAKDESPLREKINVS